MRLIKKLSLMEFNPYNIVSNHEIFGKKAKIQLPNGKYDTEKTFSENGLFSKRIFGDMETNAQYACTCGATTGKFYEGTICPKCGAPVKYIEANIDKIGWIDLTGAKYNEEGSVIEEGNDFKVIKYIQYAFLEKIFGRETLDKIITMPDVINITGEIDEEILKETRESSPEKKYWFLGIVGFYNNYQEVLNYYYELHGKKNPEIYNFLKDPYEVFTDKIPVLSTILRPAMRTSKGLKLDEINNIYIRIIKSVNILNSKIDQLAIIKDATLKIIQDEYFSLNETILENLKGKGGLIRNQICGTRINFSARNIITPAKPNVGIDEIVVPYLTFLELYKFEIINILHKIKNITLKEAEKIHFNATLTFDKEIYLIMKKIIKDDEVGVLLNRNPTINVGSILYLRISDIKEDYDDFTMSVHNCYIPLLGADYDGDVLNLISIKDRETREVFRQVFSPSKLLIDHNTGNFNEQLSLNRDQIVAFNCLLS